MSYRQVLNVLAGRGPAQLTRSQRFNLSVDSTKAFELRGEKLAADLARGRIDVDTWHAQMKKSVAQHLLEQTALGGTSGRISPSQATIAQGSLLKQNKFLRQFAAQLERAMQSEAYIANRSRLYAGAGIEEFWRSEEERLIREHGTSVGWVSRYIAVDDEGTCPACLEAEFKGPYLLGRGPMPGAVCYGRSRCRCRRVDTYDLAAWRRLTAAEATAGTPVRRTRRRGTLAA